MDMVKEKWKKNLIVMAWGRCKSFGAGFRSNNNNIKASLKRSFTVDGDQGRWRRKSHVAPEGCFSVYVGPEKQRFVVRAEFANHPLFRMLLEDAEMEYGFDSQGPIMLPCDVVLFYEVLAEMESRGDDVVSGGASSSPSCGFAMLRSPNNGFGHGYGAYRLISPSRLLKINHL